MSDKEQFIKPPNGNPIRILNHVQRWRPIETAEDPTLGRHVLLHGSGPGFEDCTIVGYWCDDFKDPGEWVTMEGRLSVKATHWMPLPEAPQ